MGDLAERVRGVNERMLERLEADEPVRMPIPGPELPTARVHVAGAPWRPWLLALAIGGALLGISQLLLLQRIDTAESWAHVARSEARLARALARHAAIVHRDLKPPNDPRVEVCMRRTDALRSAIRALVRTGNASMVGDPGWAFINWKEN